MPTLNEKETRENTRNVLVKYKRFQRFAPTKEELEHINLTDFTERAVYCLEEVNEIRAALKRVNDKGRELLIQRYITLDIFSRKDTGNKLGYTHTQYYKHLKSGELDFAEHYRQGKLLVYKD